MTTFNTDPITLEVVRYELEALMDEMHTVVRKAGRSGMLKTGDFATSITNSTGDNIGVGKQMGLTAMFEHLAHEILRLHPAIEDGDVFIINDPYTGASHLCDIFLLKPIFHCSENIAFAACYSHHSDVGGRFPGSQSGQGGSIHEEGIRIPLLKLESAGIRNRAILQLVVANVRTEDEFVGDVEAKLAGLHKADANVKQIIERYGIEAFRDCCSYLNLQSEEIIRDALSRIPAGRYSAEIFLNDNGLGPVEMPIPVCLTLDTSPTGVIVDFAGTAPQVAGAINMPLQNSIGVVMWSIRNLIAPGVPINHGLIKLIEVRCPSGALINPNYPAAVAGRAPLFFVIDELIHLALAKAMPDRVPALREQWDVLHFSRREASGEHLSLMDVFSGGWGGRPDLEGIDGIALLATTTIAAELIEREYPIVIEGFGLVPDTAGSGKHRGSLSVFRKYRFLEEADVMIRTSKLRPTSGINGGTHGAAPISIYTENGVDRILEGRSYTHLHVQAGDCLYHQVCGAGGFGDPCERDPASVLTDVIEERLSVVTAREQYRVVIIDGAVDDASTAALRGEHCLAEVGNE